MLRYCCKIIKLRREKGTGSAKIFILKQFHELSASELLLRIKSVKNIHNPEALVFGAELFQRGRQLFPAHPGGRQSFFQDSRDIIPQNMVRGKSAPLSCRYPASCPEEVFKFVGNVFFGGWTQVDHILPELPRGRVRQYIPELLGSNAVFLNDCKSFFVFFREVQVIVFMNKYIFMRPLFMNGRTCF